MSSNRLLDLDGGDDAATTPAAPSLTTADSSPPPGAAVSAPTAVGATETPSPGQSDDTGRRVALLADFGDADDGALGAALYATRVSLRRVSLRLARRRAEALLEVAHKTLEQALVPLGAALCKQQDDRALDPLAPLFEAVEAARRTARDKDTAREQLRTTTATAQREIDGSRAESEATALKLAADEAVLAAEEARLRAKLKRAQALVQRCDIEMRAAEASAVTPDPEKINGFLRQREERAAEAKTIGEQLAVVLADVGDARRALASARGVMSVLESERRSKDAQHQKIDRKHAKGTARAHHQLDAAMINLAAAALEKNLADLKSAEGDRAAKARARTEALRAEIDDLIAADAAYESEPYNTGVRLLAGVSAAIVLGLYLALRA